MSNPRFIKGNTLEVLKPFRVDSYVREDSRDMIIGEKIRVLEVSECGIYSLVVLKKWDEEPEPERTANTQVVDGSCKFIYDGKSPWTDADTNPIIQAMRTVGFDWDPRNVHLHRNSGIIIPDEW